MFYSIELTNDKGCKEMPYGQFDLDLLGVDLVVLLFLDVLVVDL